VLHQLTYQKYDRVSISTTALELGLNVTCDEELTIRTTQVGRPNGVKYLIDFIYVRPLNFVANYSLLEGS
jgi:hypothetical protein